MSELCKHGLPPMTDGDLRAYSFRDECVVVGECECETCSRICWRIECRPVKGKGAGMGANFLTKETL